MCVDRDFELWLSGTQQKDINSNRYLLRRTSVQSFKRCSSEGDLPCKTKLHFDSTESTPGVGKHARPVIEYAADLQDPLNTPLPYSTHLAESHNLGREITGSLNTFHVG